MFELRANYQDDRFRRAADLSAHCSQFADALCRVRPSGEFLLCGYSWGGLAAYETARLLAERGRTVAFLGIIDAEPFVKRTRASRGRRLWYFLRNLPYWYWDHFRLHAGKAMFRHAGIRLRGIMRPNRKAPKALFQRIFGGLDLPAELRTAVIRNIELVQRYTPAPYAGPVTLFRARARPLFPSVMSVDSGWGPFVTGRLDVVQLKCHHSNILAEPHLSQLVRVLRARAARS